MSEFDPRESIRAERLDLCRFLETLEADQWSAASLCPGWTVSEVVAHLITATTETWRGFLFGMVRYRGDFDKRTAIQATALADRHDPVALIGLLRAAADSARRAPGSAPLDPLLDVVVHGQDIARPLGVTRPIPTERAVAALDHAVTSRWYGARQRLAGLHLVADDAEWTHGQGLAVTGPLAALLLVATGRAAGLDELRGDGVSALVERTRTKDAP